jgi:hypothetical protein
MGLNIDAVVRTASEAVRYRGASIEAAVRAAVLDHLKAIGSEADQDAGAFLYKADPVDLDPDDVQTVVSAIQGKISKEAGRWSGEVGLLTWVEMTERDAAVGDALSRLWRTVPGNDLAQKHPDLIVCEMAWPHTDSSYAGTKFLSLVLHTGSGGPYAVQTIETGTEEGLPSVRTNSRVLEVGDVFVMDPTAPHMAAPIAMEPDSMLILLQAVICDSDSDGHARLKTAVPRAAEDRNEPFYR